PPGAPTGDGSCQFEPTRSRPDNRVTKDKLEGQRFALWARSREGPAAAPNPSERIVSLQRTPHGRAGQKGDNRTLPLLRGELWRGLDIPSSEGVVFDSNRDDGPSRRSWSVYCGEAKSSDAALRCRVGGTGREDRSGTFFPMFPDLAMNGSH